MAVRSPRYPVKSSLPSNSSLLLLPLSFSPSLPLSPPSPLSSPPLLSPPSLSSPPLHPTWVADRPTSGHHGYAWPTCGARHSQELRDPMARCPSRYKRPANLYRNALGWGPLSTRDDDLFVPERGYGTQFGTA
eukprot:2422678-Rhodomonas_salina.1